MRLRHVTRGTTQRKRIAKNESPAPSHLIDAAERGGKRLTTPRSLPLKVCRPTTLALTRKGDRN